MVVGTITEVGLRDSRNTSQLYSIYGGAIWRVRSRQQHIYMARKLFLGKKYTYRHKANIIATHIGHYTHINIVTHTHTLILRYIIITLRHIAYAIVVVMP